MDQRHWQEIEKIIDHILASDDPKAKNAILRKTLEDSPELYEEILHLLKYIRKAEKNNFLENSSSLLD